MIPGYLSPLANHLWQSTLFAAAAGLLTLVLRNNRAAVRYGLWLAASAKFLIPFSLLVSIGSQFQWRPAAAIAPGGLSVSIDQVFAPPAFQAAANAAASSASPIPTAILAIWALGFAVVLFSWWRDWQPIRRALLRATPLRLSAPGLATTLDVRTSPDLMEPAVVGVRRPILLLPDGITEHLQPSELHAILAHELCHLRRRDNLAAMMHMLVEALFWFHPLVWWIEARLVDERERACDEAVLQSGNDPAVYAESILKICRLYAQSSLACASGVSGASLKHRVERIMENAKLIRLSRTKLALLATIGAGTLLVPMAAGLLTPRPASSAQIHRVARAPGSSPLAAAGPQPGNVRTTAGPGTEAWLRRYIAAIQEGRPNYEDMTPAQAADARSSLPRLQKLGRLKTLTFKNVSIDGADVYDAEFEKGHVEYRIHPLMPNGIVPGVSYTIAPTLEEEVTIKQRIAAGKPDRERGALLRKYLAAVGKGELDPEILSPHLVGETATFLKIRQIALQLGTFKSLQFFYVDRRGWDVYEATYSNGNMFYLVGPLTDHKLSLLDGEP